MGSINGYPQLMTDWRSLLSAWKHNAELMSASVEDRDLLESLLAEAQRLKSLQDRLRAERQLATQQLSAVMAQGKEAAIRIRALARSKIGPKSEGLVHFKVAPNRPRPRKNRQAPEEMPPAQEE